MNNDFQGKNEPLHPNILILCMDQWDTHMDLPEDVRFPAMERLEKQGVSFDRQYCTVPNLHAVPGDDVDGRSCQENRVMGQHQFFVDQRIVLLISHDRSDVARTRLLHGIQGQMALFSSAAQRGCP